MCRPRISSVLHQTSYLVAPTVKNRSLTDPTSFTDGEDLNDIAYAPITPQVRERTSVRLLETLQFVLDIMGSPLPIASVDAAQGDVERPSDYDALNASRLGPACLRPLTGEGWKSVIRTRILHGIVRRRLMNTVKDGKYNFEKGEFKLSGGKACHIDLECSCHFLLTDGYPLNAEDMTATLGSFCIPPIVASLKIGSPMPLHLQAAYISKLPLHLLPTVLLLIFLGRSLAACRLLLGHTKRHSCTAFRRLAVIGTGKQDFRFIINASVGTPY